MSDNYIHNNLLFKRIAFFLLIGLIISEYSDIVFGGFAFFFRDFGAFSYPNAYYVRKCFLSNELPLWNPHNEFGIPFLAQWNTMVLYPFNFFFILLQPEWAISLFTLSHLALGGLGAFCLAKFLTKNEFAAFVAAIGYEFNGITINSLMWTNNSAAFGWMPWAILAFIQAVKAKQFKTTARAVIICSTQVLTGAPEIIGFTWIIGLLLATCELTKAYEKARILKRMGVIIFGTFFLTAAQLIPFFQLLFNSHRMVSGGDNSWALGSLLNLFIPFYNAFQWDYGIVFQKDQYWTSSIYIPTGIIFSGIWGAIYSKNKQKWVLITLCLAGILFSFGDKFLLFNAVGKLIPTIKTIRFPIKFLILTMVSIQLLAAYGLATLLSTNIHKRTPLIILWMIFISLFMCAGFLCIKESAPGCLPGEVVLGNIVVRCIFLSIFVSIVYLSLKHLKFIHLFLLLGIISIFLDFKTHTPRQNPGVENWVYNPDLLKNERPEGFFEGRIITRHDKDYFRYNLARNDQVAEVISKRLGLYSNLNLLEEGNKLTGMFSLHLPASYVLIDKIYENENHIPQGLADFLSIKWMLNPDKQYAWIQNKNAMPLISAGQKINPADANQILNEMFTTEFKPDKTAFVESNVIEEFKNVEPDETKVNILRKSNHSISARIISTKNTTLIFSSAFYPCWKAKIDKIDTKVFSVNYGFQTVIVPPGEHTVTFLYKDNSFLISLFLSLLTLCFIAMIFKSSDKYFENS